MKKLFLLLWWFVGVASSPRFQDNKKMKRRKLMQRFRLSGCSPVIAETSRIVLGV